MRPIGLFMAFVSLVSLTACSEYNVRLATPELRLSDDAFRWDGVVVGTEDARTVGISNAGRGDLVLQSPVLADPVGVFELLELDSLRIGPDERIDLTVMFAPDGPGRSRAQIDLQTNDPDRPTVTLPLDGTATEPQIELWPDPLTFGWVRPGTTATRTLRIQASGSGVLDVHATRFQDPLLDQAFTVSVPEPLPLPLGAGRELVAVVVFRPSDAQRYDGRLEVLSNAVNPEAGAVRVIANGDINPEVNASPLVDIVTPAAGTQVLPGQVVRILAATFDEEDGPDALTAELYVDGVAIDRATPDADGTVPFEAIVAQRDASTLEVTVMDSEGAIGSDTVVVDVLDPDESSTYVISGGSDPSAPFAVDDDVRIEVDGVAVLADSNTVIDTHGPVSFEAARFAEIRIIATDQQFCEAAIDALTLHATLSGETQELNTARCRSACTGTPCFDATFDGPWPSVFLDETYPIAIP